MPKGSKCVNIFAAMLTNPFIIYLRQSRKKENKAFPEISFEKGRIPKSLIYNEQKGCLFVTQCASIGIGMTACCYMCQSHVLLLSFNTLVARHNYVHL